MNDIHTPHRPTRVIPNPLIPIQIIRLNLSVRVSHLDPLQQISDEKGTVQISVGEGLKLRLIG
jgi:hypothetical protein